MRLKLSPWWQVHLMEVILIGALAFIVVGAVYAVSWKLNVGRVPSIFEVSRLETHAEGETIGYTWLTPLHVIQASDGRVMIDIGGSRDQFHIGDRVAFIDDTGKIRDWQVWSIHNHTLNEFFDLYDWSFYGWPVQQGHFVTFLTDR